MAFERLHRDTDFPGACLHPGIEPVLRFQLVFQTRRDREQHRDIPGPHARAHKGRHAAGLQRLRQLLPIFFGKQFRQGCVGQEQKIGIAGHLGLEPGHLVFGEFQKQPVRTGEQGGHAPCRGVEPGVREMHRPHQVQHGRAPARHPVVAAGIWRCGQLLRQFRAVLRCQGRRQIGACTARKCGQRNSPGEKRDGDEADHENSCG